jgi:hypothetical protein
MTAHVDPAGPAEAGQQLARADAVPLNTGETRHLETELGVAVKHALLTGPVPQLHVAHRSVTGISEPSTPTEQELLDEIRVDAGLGAWAAHVVLPIPGGAS